MKLISFMRPHVRHFYTSCCCNNKKFVNPDDKSTFNVKEHLRNKIITTGPISVAEFMRATLISPSSGYYMKQDVFGSDGDFITSPELSQMFGELIGVWLVSEWAAHGSPTDVNVVELGPGRGTLADDVMRTFSQLHKTWKGTTPSFHLVEISPALTTIQQETLCPDALLACDEASVPIISKHGFPVSWHRTLENVPRADCMLFVAHEFFDALPVHKFVRGKDGWREVYVDVADNHEDFRFTLMPVPTPACKTLVQDIDDRDHVEVSPESAIICRDMASMISGGCGSSLLADYGGFGTTQDTLRGFKKHTQVDVFHDVGHCDITADVDFKYLHDNLNDSLVTCSGPITQRTFLRNMGIDTRLMMLLRHTTDDDIRRKLIGSYDVITNPDKMGDRFKFFAISSRDNVTGFSSPPTDV